MCDFRDVRCIEFKGKKIYPPRFSIDPADIEHMQTAGLYYICCTGSHYMYFDGKDWYREYRNSEFLPQYNNLNGFKVTGISLTEDTTYGQIISIEEVNKNEN